MTYILIEISCPIFKNYINSIYMPTEIAYIIYDDSSIKEIYSSRVKYNLTIYNKNNWDKMFYFYVSKFPAVFLTKSFYKKHQIEFKDKPIEYFYSSKYGIDPNKLRNNLINKIKKLNLIVYVKNKIRLTYFLNDASININEITYLPRYDNLQENYKINVLSEYFKKYQNLMKITSPIKLEYIYNEEIPLYKIIIYHNIIYSPTNNPINPIIGADAT